MTETVLKLKHQDKISKLNLTDCPPKESKQKDCECFRFCFDNLAHPDTWITQAEKLTAIGKFPRGNANDRRTCEDFGLSFFIDEENARITWRAFPAGIKKMLGYTKVMTGKILKTDGLCTATTHQGHFNLHEYEKCNLNGRFKIASSL